MGSRILSRSFRVEKWDGADVEDQQQSDPPETNDMMDVDDQVGDVTNGLPINGEPVLGGKDDSDSEDGDDPADIAMVPMADVLNARYGSENVHPSPFFLFTL
jgi:SET domain-containing protein 6